MSKEEDADTSKQNRRVLIRPQAHRQLQKLAEREEADVAELVNRACRDLLRAEGLWPPTTEQKDNSTGLSGA